MKIYVVKQGKKNTANENYSKFEEKERFTNIQEARTFYNSIKKKGDSNSFHRFYQMTFIEKADMGLYGKLVNEENNKILEFAEYQFVGMKYWKC